METSVLSAFPPPPRPLGLERGWGFAASVRLRIALQESIPPHVPSVAVLKIMPDYHRLFIVCRKFLSRFTNEAELLKPDGALLRRETRRTRGPNPGAKDTG